MAQIFAAFGKSVGNNKGSVQNFGIVGITIASEELTKFIFFFCPCDYPDNKVYGSIFIWGPAIILFIVGYLVNRRTWRLTTGMCNRTQGIGKGGKRIFHFIFIFFQVGIKAIIAPATWVVLAFLKGDYYACARWPDPQDYSLRSHFNLPASNQSLPLPCQYNPNPVKFSFTAEAEIIARNLRAESHVIGWFYLCIGMFVGVVVMFAFRCRSKYSYEQSNYIERYRKSEVEFFEDELEKKAEEQAKRIVEGFFTKPRAKEEWDQIAVINDKVTRSKRGRAIYSPLHKFVNKELRAAEDANDKDKAMGIVSDAAMKTKRLTAVKKQKAGQNDKSSSKPSGGDATAIPMVAMMSMGKPTTTVVKVKQEEKKPPASKQPSEQGKPTVEEKKTQDPPKDVQKPPAEIPPAEALPEVQVVDPATPHQQQPVVVPSIPPPPKKDRVTPSQGQQAAPPEDRPPPPLPKEEPGEIKAAVRETALGDFGGAFSREDLRNQPEDDEDPVPVGDKVILFEDEEEDSEEVKDSHPHEQEADVVVHAEDEEPLLPED